MTGGDLAQVLQRHKREKQPFDALGRDQLQQADRVESQLVGHQHQRPAGGPGGEHLLEVHIEAQGRELQRARPWTGHRRLALPGDQVRQRGAPEGHSLGVPGRSRGVDDVGQRVGAHGPWRDPLHGRALEHGAVAVQAEDARVARGQGLHQRRLGQHHRRPGIAQHEGKPGSGVGRIEGSISAASLEHRQHRGHHVERSFEAHAHQHVGPHPQLAQVVSELVGPAVQLPVGEHRAAQSDRWSVRGLIDLALEHLEERVRHGSLAPGCQRKLNRPHRTACSPPASDASSHRCLGPRACVNAIRGVMVCRVTTWSQEEKHPGPAW